MRSLTLLSSISAPLPVPPSSKSKRATATAFDPESSLVYTAVEFVSPDGVLEIDLFQVKGITDEDVEPVGTPLLILQGAISN